MDKTEKNDRTRQKNKRGDIEKWDQNDSPEIQGQGRDIRNPFGGL